MKWEKQFDEKYTEKKFCCCGYEYCYPGDIQSDLNDIKQFIKTLLKEEREKLIKEIDKIVDKDCITRSYYLRDHIIEKLKTN